MTSRVAVRVQLWGLLVLTCLGLGVGVATTVAAQSAPAKILVLTTDEGMPGDARSYQAGGKTNSDNLAKAFGFSNSGLVTPPPDITYHYGALSTRRVNVSGPNADAILKGSAVSTNAALYPNQAAPSTGPASKIVRVLTAADTALNADGTIASQETVVYVPDNTPSPDPQNLNSVFKPAAGGRYDLVVIGSTYFKITDQSYLALAKLMQDPELRPNAILYFVDSCCDAASHAYSMNMARLNQLILKPATADYVPTPGIGIGTTDGGVNPNVPLVTGSTAKYADSFRTLLPEIQGNAFNYLTGVPAVNTLFGYVSSTSPATVSTFGAFFPSTQIFDGNGTCTFAVVDISPFDRLENPGNGTYPYDYNTGANPKNGHNIGQAFVNAALAGGSCGGMATISASPDAAVTLANRTTNITLTVKNESLPAAAGSPPGTGSISGGRVEASLPAPLQFTGTNVLTTTCTLDPATPTGTNTDTAFSVKGISIPNEGSCTITLPVQWTDTAELSTNACINASKNSTSLSIVPGEPNQFSTTQGQTHAIAKTAVGCTAPELALSIPTAIASSYAAGATVSYDVKVDNLSQTAAAPALGAVLSGLAPAGITLTTIEEKSAASMLKAGPVACTSADNCPLPADIPAGGSSTFTVSFVAPANSPTMAWTPTVALAVPASEVTTTNNSVQLASTTQSALTVQAQLNGPGIDSSSALNNAGMAYNVSGCTATPASGSAPLGINAAGAAQPSTMPSGTPCVVAFTGAPDASQLPTGYGITGPVITTSAPDATTGNQTSVAVWTALPPGLAAITGSVVGGPTPFPASLVGKTLNYTLTCQASPAQQPSGKLTIGANGQLTTTDNLTVPGGSTCTLTVDGLAQLPTAPSDYRWSSASAAPGGAANSFVVALTLRSNRDIGDVTPVPTLGQWALYLLSTMMLMAAALRLRQRRV